MNLSPDEIVFWQNNFFTLNATILWTWAVILFLCLGSFLITRNLKTDIHISRWQSLLEIIVTSINKQIEEIGLKESKKYIGFIGTLFLFIAISNLFTIFPGYFPPTGSLSTTVALAMSVFLAVPFFGISQSGVKAYLKTYIQPTVMMLPFNIISEVSRTIALAVRLFGNIMSGGMIVAIILSIVPFFFPIIMNALGLLTGMVQAYIFSVLASVYIASATSITKTNRIINQ